MEFLKINLFWNLHFACIYKYVLLTLHETLCTEKIATAISFDVASANNLIPTIWET